MPLPARPCPLRAAADLRVHVVAPGQWVGEEEILSASRRVYSASAREVGTIVLRVPAQDYRGVLVSEGPRHL